MKKLFWMIFVSMALFSTAMAIDGSDVILDVTGDVYTISNGIINYTLDTCTSPYPNSNFRYWNTSSDSWSRNFSYIYRSSGSGASHSPECIIVTNTSDMVVINRTNSANHTILISMYRGLPILRFDTEMAISSNGEEMAFAPYSDYFRDNWRVMYYGVNSTPLNISNAFSQTYEIANHLESNYVVMWNTVENVSFVFAVQYMATGLKNLGRFNDPTTNLFRPLSNAYPADYSSHNNSYILIVLPDIHTSNFSYYTNTTEWNDTMNSGLTNWVTTGSSSIGTWLCPSGYSINLDYNEYAHNVTNFDFTSCDRYWISFFVKGWNAGLTTLKVNYYLGNGTLIQVDDITYTPTCTYKQYEVGKYGWNEGAYIGFNVSGTGSSGADWYVDSVAYICDEHHIDTPPDTDTDSIPDGVDNDTASYTYWGRTWGVPVPSIWANYPLSKINNITHTLLSTNPYIWNMSISWEKLANDWSITSHFVIPYPSSSVDYYLDPDVSIVGQLLYPARTTGTTQYNWVLWSNESVSPLPYINTSFFSGIRLNRTETSWYYVLDVEANHTCNITTAQNITTNDSLNVTTIYSRAYLINQTNTILNISCINNDGEIGFYSLSIPTYYGNVSVYDEETQGLFNLTGHNITLYALLENRAYTVFNISQNTYFFTLNESPIYFRAIVDEDYFRSKLADVPETIIYIYDHDLYPSSETVIQISTIPYTDPIRITRLVEGGEIIIHEAYPIGVDQEVIVYLMNTRPYNVYAFPSGSLLTAVRLTDLLPTGASTIILSVPDILFDIVNFGDLYIQFNAENNGTENIYDLQATAIATGSITISIYDENDTLISTGTFTDSGSLIKNINISEDGEFFKAIFTINDFEFSRNLNVPSSFSFMDLGYFDLATEGMSVLAVLGTIALMGSIVVLDQGLSIAFIGSGALLLLLTWALNLLEILQYLGLLYVIVGAILYIFREANN